MGYFIKIQPKNKIQIKRALDFLKKMGYTWSIDGLCPECVLNGDTKALYGIDSGMGRNIIYTPAHCSDEHVISYANKNNAVEVFLGCEYEEID
ncbi:MAG: hypothetical protein PHC62_06875 [Candidatus Izemoplasmatales bacterium]|nr:hypothetical protein [Candidatus Izemoplasmatales bacterium]